MSGSAQSAATETQPPAPMQHCIEICWKCRHECQSTLFNHCLSVGGDHVAEAHIKIMMDCIQICQLAADAMVRQSPLQAEICAACAEVCEACAISCEALEGPEMKVCAEQCREMGEMKHLISLPKDGGVNVNQAAS